MIAQTYTFGSGRHMSYAGLNGKPIHINNCYPIMTIPINSSSTDCIKLKVKRNNSYTCNNIMYRQNCSDPPTY